MDNSQWEAYGCAYAFAGNELLVPMNRSGERAGLDPCFWETVPVADNDHAFNGASRLRAYAERARSAAHETPEGLAYSDDSHVPGVLASSVEFAHLFIGPPKPAVDPWETLQDPRNERHIGFGSATRDMRRLLAQEGFQLADGKRQYEDHMGIELLFASALCDKVCSARADARDDAEEQAISFIKVHPLRWMDRFRSRVEEERPEGYYAPLLEYAQGMLEDHKGEWEG